MDHLLTCGQADMRAYCMSAGKGSYILHVGVELPGKSALELKRSLLESRLEEYCLKEFDLADDNSPLFSEPSSLR